MKKNHMTKMTIIYFVIAAIMALTAGSLAAYTSLSSVKRVVTVKGTEQLFTSDVLLEYNNISDLQKRVISFGEGIEEKQFKFNISNHIQGDATKFDTKGLTYLLKFEIVDSFGNVVADSIDSEGNTLYSHLRINDNVFTEGYTVESVFSGDSAYDDEYTITLDSLIMNYYLRITAVPSGNIYKSIGRIIAFSMDATSASGWVGSFIDAEQNTIQNGQNLGIINFRISGQTEGDYKLSWDSSRIEIDGWFLDKFGLSNSNISLEKDGKTKSLTLHLGEVGTSDQYIITFYRTYAEKDLNETWNTIQSYIVFNEIE